MNFTVAAAIDSLGTSPYVVTRRVSGGYDGSGRALPATTSTFTIQAMVQPLSGRELDRLPEGFKNSEVRYVWTKATLKVAPDGGNESDSIAIDGSNWQVSKIETWEQAGYQRVLVTQV